MAKKVRGKESPAHRTKKSKKDISDLERALYGPVDETIAPTSATAAVPSVAEVMSTIRKVTTPEKPSNGVSDCCCAHTALEIGAMITARLAAPNALTAGAMGEYIRSIGEKKFALAVALRMENASPSKNDKRWKVPQVLPWITKLLKFYETIGDSSYEPLMKLSFAPLEIVSMVITWADVSVPCSAVSRHISLNKPHMSLDAIADTIAVIRGEKAVSVDSPAVKDITRALVKGAKQSSQQPDQARSTQSLQQPDQARSTQAQRDQKTPVVLTEKQAPAFALAETGSTAKTQAVALEEVVEATAITQPTQARLSKATAATGPIRAQCIMNIEAPDGEPYLQDPEPIYAWIRANLISSPYKVTYEVEMAGAVYQDHLYDWYVLAFTPYAETLALVNRVELIELVRDVFPSATPRRTSPHRTAIMIGLGWRRVQIADLQELVVEAGKEVKEGAYKAMKEEEFLTHSQANFDRPWARVFTSPVTVPPSSDEGVRYVTQKQLYEAWRGLREDSIGNTALPPALSVSEIMLRAVQAYDSVTEMYDYELDTVVVRGVTMNDPEPSLKKPGWHTNDQGVFTFIRLDPDWKRECRGLRLLDEPERTNSWLRISFVEDDTSAIDPKALWRAYEACFNRWHERRPTLDDVELEAAFCKMLDAGIVGIAPNHFLTGVAPRLPLRTATEQMQLNADKAHRHRLRSLARMEIHDNNHSPKPINAFAAALRVDPLMPLPAGVESPWLASQRDRDCGAPLGDTQTGFPLVSLRELTRTWRQKTADADAWARSGFTGREPRGAYSWQAIEACRRWSYLRGVNRLAQEPANAKK